jgi:phosphosulfolactate phosphohydrolase-like enzyme
MIRIYHGEAGVREAVQPTSILVIIDALRASVTLTALIEGAAEQVHVCGRLEDCYLVKKILTKSPLVGEWNNASPEGFTFDNSPESILSSDIKGSSPVFLSTNGARMLLAAEGAGEIIIASVANISAVVDYLSDRRGQFSEIAIIAAGDREKECDEDSASAALLAVATGPDIDPGQEDMILGWQSKIASSSLGHIFENSFHGKELADRHKLTDLKFCHQVDTMSKIAKVTGYTTINGARVCLVSAAH